MKLKCTLCDKKVFRGIVMHKSCYKKIIKKISGIRKNIIYKNEYEMNLVISLLQQLEDELKERIS